MVGTPDSPSDCTAVYACSAELFQLPLSSAPRFSTAWGIVSAKRWNSCWSVADYLGARKIFHSFASHPGARTLTAHKHNVRILRFSGRAFCLRSSVTNMRKNTRNPHMTHTNSHRDPSTDPFIKPPRVEATKECFGIH